MRGEQGESWSVAIVPTTHHPPHTTLHTPHTPHITHNYTIPTTHHAPHTTHHTQTVSAEEQGGAAEVVPPLPPHWTQHRDETSGYDYFYNDVTGTTQWERPVADAPAPARVPPPPPLPPPAPAPAAEATADDRELMEWARQNPRRDRGQARGGQTDHRRG